jgi:hypothetical protein
LSVGSLVSSLRTSLSTAPTLYVGAALAVTAIAVYGVSGYGGWIVVLWFIGLLLIATQLLATSGRLGPVAGRDMLAPFLLMLAFAPLYLGRLYAWPVQVSSDEVAIMDFAKRYADMPHVDLFGLSGLFGDPAGQLVVWGKLGGFFGGVDLEHMRLVHALCGLLIIGISYALFRQLLPMGWAVLGSVVLGLNHTLLMMSRMAMKENLPALLEVSALTLLLFGLRRQNRFATFAGGAIAGLGVYVHYSGRLFFPLWILFLVVLAIAYRRSLGFDRLVGAAAVAVAGFALVVTPYAIAYQRAPQALKEHTQEANLLTAKGRKFQQGWVYAPTVWAGYKRNVINGLTAFNYGRQDHAWIYNDKGHGIVDPLTGVLLWIGALAVLLRVVRRRGPPWALLPLTSFLALWLMYAFVIGQAPDYSRMLIVLPFVAYLVAEAVRALTEIGQRLLSARWRFAPALPLAAGAAAVLAIGVWNGFIGWDYIDTGQKTGDDIGSTGRYVHKHSRNPKQRFFIAADQTQFTYYQWGWPSTWEARIRFFASSPAQVGGVIAPSQLGQFSATAPFTVFTRSDLWSQVQNQFQTRYPGARVDRITPDGRLLAVNVT